MREYVGHSEPYPGSYQDRIRMPSSLKDKASAARGSRSQSTSHINDKTTSKQKTKLSRKSHSTQHLEKSAPFIPVGSLSDTSSSLGSLSVVRSHASSSKIEVHEKILRGNLDEISPPKQALVRVYFCSNPNDSALERAALWKQLVPSLRQCCQEEHDIEFQVIDINAGCASSLLTSKEKRIKEIKTCQQKSISTCFVALIGHKYWSPSIPTCIDAQLFDVLLKVAYEAKLSNCRLLEEFYLRDENAMPPNYVLRHSNEIAKTMNNSHNSSNGNGMGNVAMKLQDLLHDTAVKALNGKAITQTQADLFLVSNLEVELGQGILSNTVHDATNCVCYVRTINGMETDMNCARVKKYIDIVKAYSNVTGLYVTDDMLDHNAKSRLHSIREKQLPERVLASDGQIRVYKCAVTWMPQVGLQSDTHSIYLEDFCSQLHNVVKKMTTQNIHKAQENTSVGEALCHCLIAKDLYQHHYDLSQDVIKSINEYICNPTTKPLVIHGCKGSGKTYMMATVASEVMDWLTNANKPVCTVRFIGHTCLSSYTVLLLDSLCNQLEKSIGIPQEPWNMWCTDVSYQQKRFVSIIQRASCDQPMIILLDGIDKLLDIDAFNKLSEWLPINLPENVKIIISVDSDSSVYEKISTLARELSLTMLTTKLLSHSEYSTFLRHRLANDNRRMTSGQHVFAIQAKRNKDKQYTACMAHLVHMHATRWRSSKDVTKETLGQKEVDVIQHYMQGLQEIYGENVVRVAATLITTSKFGITEQELQETMLTSASVKSDISRKHQGRQSGGKSDLPISETQSLLAISLLNLLEDLSPLLLSKLIGGCQVHCWSNTIISAAMTMLYLRDKDVRQSAHKSLIKCYKDHIGHGRYPTNQKVPLKTLHVCFELPFHLEDKQHQTEVMNLCYLNFYWLSALLRSFGIVPTLFFLEKAYRLYRDRSALVIERSIRLALSLLQRSTSAFPGELFSRILPFLENFPSLQRLITQCTSQRLKVCSLLPAGVHAQAPGAPLRVSFDEATSIVNDLHINEVNSSITLAYCTQKRLKIFDMINGDLIREMIFNEDIEWMRVTKNKQFIVILSGQRHNLFILDEKASQCLHKKISLDGSFDVGYKSTPVKEVDSVVSAALIAVWARNYSQQVLLFEVKTSKVIQILKCDYQVHSCLISEDEQFVYVVHLPRTIAVFSTFTGNMLCSLGSGPLPAMGHIVNLFENCNGHLIAVYSSGFVHVWDKTTRGQFNHVIELDSRSSYPRQHFSVIHTSMSDDQRQLVVVKPMEIDVWDLHQWKTVCEIPRRKNELFATAYFANQQKYLLVTLAGDGLSIYVWDISSSPIACISILDGHMGAIKKLRVPNLKSPNNSSWALTVSSDDSIKVWNLENLPLISTLTMTGRSITKVICVGNHTVTVDDSDKITVWDVSNGDIAFQLKHAAAVMQCTISMWSSKAVTADTLGYQYVWDLNNGENLFKMKGPKVDYVLITPNDQLVVSIFHAKSIEPSRVWRLNTAQVVCTFDYTITEAKITSKNTFLVGISSDGKLHAISLWTGLLAKVLCRPGFNVTMIQVLSWHDHVLAIDSGNFITVWNIAEETSLISLDMKNNIMHDVCISDSGAILTMVDLNDNMRVLDVTHGKLRKIDTLGCPLMTQLTWDGLHLLYISMKNQEILKETDDTLKEVHYYLVVVKMTGNRIMSTYPLESKPTCMQIAKSGETVAVGLEEGRVIVFNIVGQDTKLSYPSKHKAKRTERIIFYPKEKCDHTWHSREPEYASGHSASDHHNSSNSSERHQLHAKEAPQEAIKKMSIHMPRAFKPDTQSKSINMRRLGNNTSKVKVFM